MRPLADVEATAGAIAEGDLERRVPGDEAPTEVGHLAKSLNTMLGRIQAAFAERDATEAELRRSEARLRRFVADASHELRTPVAAVAAYAELFERGANDRPVDLARVMSGIRVETSRMGELVDDLLLLARLDEGRPLAREPLELVSIAAQAVDAARTVGPQWPVRLEAGQPVEILGDAARLRQVLDNLLANVRAHTPEGTSVVVKVGQEGDEAIVVVSDDGPGMTADEASHVFERFYRVDQSRSREHGGAGLGLAIVAAIVESHGGTVSASSAPGRGATFTVRLPATASPGPSFEELPADGAIALPAPDPASPVQELS
jgi:two-component system OmpR family sensor kinase